MYVTYLHECGFKTSTIKTHLSAISFVHQVLNLKNPTRTFVIQKILNRYSKLDSPPAVRNPISAKLLKRLVCSVKSSVHHRYTKVLLISLFTLMYHGVLRCSEICYSAITSHTLQYNQIYLVHHHSKPALKIKFTSYKHSGQKITPLLICSTFDHICPVKAFIKYQALRGTHEGPLFCDQYRNPISRQQLLSYMHHHLSLVGCNASNFNTHSFRIGRTTDLAAQGYTHMEIKNIGRWKSDAYLCYIKPDFITSA